MTLPLFPCISAQQMRQIDTLVIKEYGIDLLQMMENAGRNLAMFTKEIVPNHPSILVIAGKGGNGGGALCAARHLHNYGLTVSVALASPIDACHPATQHQYQTLSAMGISFQSDLSHAGDADVILDGLFGYSLSGPPRGIYVEWIRMMNTSGSKIISLDIPSGLDASDGQAFIPCIKADYTLTLALPKIGLVKKNGPLYSGRIFLADISIPEAVYVRMGLLKFPINIFSQNPIIPIT